jgi:hypothetical protein
MTLLKDILILYLTSHIKGHSHPLSNITYCMITDNFIIYTGDGVWMFHQIVSGNAMCLL